MTQREIDLMRALTAAMAALWDVVDGEPVSMERLCIMMRDANLILQNLRQEKGR